MNVKAAVVSELAGMPEGVRALPQAAAALVLADLLEGASPRDAATVSKELRLTLAELRKAAEATAPQEVDPVDELAGRRAARITTEAPDRSAAAGERRARSDRPGRQRRTDPR